MKPFKNIIFDLGGIFMDVDYKKAEKAFLNLGISNYKDLYKQDFSSTLFEELETGKIDSEYFYNQLRTLTKSNYTNLELENAWNAMLGSFPLERLEWLGIVKEKYKIFLYSNTNQIHHSSFTKRFTEETGIENFDDFFIHAYYSHLFGLRKPYKESYQKILEEQHLQPQETLFIDDTLVNIIGAKEAGLQTYHLVFPETVLDLNFLS